MKVFIGCEDIASVLSGLAEGFRDLGHPVTTFVFSRNKFYPETEYDIVANELFASWFPAKLWNHFPSARNRMNSAITDFALAQKTRTWIKGYDLFIFIWRTWSPNERLLFQRIKEANKKLICLHLGSDVRHISAYQQEFTEDVSSWESYYHTDDLNEKIEKIRIHETYADAIFSVPDQAGLAIRPYHHIYLPISRKKGIQYHVPNREKPIIMHAPSRSGIKGTQVIIETLDRLRLEGYAFDFRLVQNLSNPQLMQELTQADILVDEILLHGPGVLGAEAMLSGCAVVTRTMKKYNNIFDPPVLNVSPSTLYEQIKLLLNTISFRIELAVKGKAFADQYNNPAHIAASMLAKLKASGADYFPVFYLEKYTLPKNLTLTKLNLTLSLQIARTYYGGDPANLQRAQLEGLI